MTQPSLTILTVDDDVLINIGTAATLEELGHRALEVSSCDEALALLAGDGPIDLLLTDFAMPGLNGLELARRARALRPGLPILLVTGYGELPGGAETDLPRIGKPMRSQDLAAQIATLVAAGTPVGL